jgi:hypothetical protein
VEVVPKEGEISKVATGAVLIFSLQEVIRRERRENRVIRLNVLNLKFFILNPDLTDDYKVNNFHMKHPVATGPENSCMFFYIFG